MDIKLRPFNFVFYDHGLGKLIDNDYFFKFMINDKHQDRLTDLRIIIRDYLGTKAQYNDL